jgi:hypothetical protein
MFSDVNRVFGYMMVLIHWLKVVHHGSVVLHRLIYNVLYRLIICKWTEVG